MQEVEYIQTGNQTIRAGQHMWPALYTPRNLPAAGAVVVCDCLTQPSFLLAGLYSVTFGGGARPLHETRDVTPYLRNSARLKLYFHAIVQRPTHQRLVTEYQSNSLEVDRTWWSNYNYRCGMISTCSHHRMLHRNRNIRAVASWADILARFS